LQLLALDPARVTVSNDDGWGSDGYAGKKNVDHTRRLREERSDRQALQLSLRRAEGGPVNAKAKW